MRRELRAIVVLALPLIGGQLSTMGMNLIDVLLAGHLGAQVLGPVGVGTSVWMLAVVSINGLMMAVPASVAQLDGAKRRDAVWSLFTQALMLAIAVGSGLGMLIAMLGPLLIGAMGVTPDLLQGATQFLHVIAPAAPAMGILFACKGLSEGLSMTRPSFLFSLLGPVVLAPIGYILMYGRLGMPPLGVFGAALATLIVCWVQALAFLTFVLLSRRYEGLGRGKTTCSIDTVALRGLLKLGTPMGITLLMESGLFIATTLVIGRLGEQAVATHQIAFSVASLTFMVPLGLSMAITVRVAHAKGRGDLHGVRQAGFGGIGLALCSQTVTGAAMLLMPGILAGFYTSDPAVIAGATVLLRLAGFFQISDGLQVAANGALRGVKDTRLPMAVTLFAYWLVGMPVGVWLSIGREQGAAGMWIGLLVGLTVSAILLLIRFARVSRVREARVAHGVA
jgi:MATE family multidrug resistance protein